MEGYVRIGTGDLLFDLREDAAAAVETMLKSCLSMFAFLGLFLHAPAAHAAVGGTSGAGGLIDSSGNLQGIDIVKSSSSAGKDFVTIINRFLSLVVLAGTIGIVVALVGAGYKAAVTQDNREAQAMLARALIGSLFVVCAYGLANYLQYSFGVTY